MRWYLLPYRTILPSLYKGNKLSIEMHNVLWDEAASIEGPISTTCLSGSLWTHLWHLYHHAL